MSVEELRAHFERIAGAVTPDVDPYGAVVRRAGLRRRRRLRGLGTAVAALTAVALAGPAALNAAGWDELPPANTPSGPFVGLPVHSSWTWRLINSPTRGNLAHDQSLIQDITREFAQTGDIRNGFGLLGKAPSSKVLFADEDTDSRTVIVAYYSKSEAMLVTRSSHRGASAADLVKGSGTTKPWVDPFTIVGESFGGSLRAQHWVGLAPSGCRVDTSTNGVVQPDGTVRRTWQPSPNGDYIVSEDYPPLALWRVICDGVVRFQSPAAWQGAYDDRVEAAAKAPTDVKTSWAGIDPATAATALAAHRGLSEHAGLQTSNAEVRWGGSVPGTGGEEAPAVLVGPKSGAGPVVLQVGESTALIVALGPTPQIRHYYTSKYVDRMSWTTAASTASSELIAIRIPVRQDLGAIATDNMLVVAPPTAVKVEATVNGRQVWKASPLDDGAGIFNVRYRGDVTLRALDATGAVLATAPLQDRARGNYLFGEEVIANW
ncbi:hypothetical protein [Asanoa siamensis]|uniref:Uncharacterized protein n=1 Tax=Asanoa siamensis TaxID=926357 RepID=A0ABQ4D0B3_9ACTN|nr:hypothetical protein [Asanoa siamensis]GIF76982.1 hypothetical protein Asi02nite_65000 [Asanoa siamensis]